MTGRNDEPTDGEIDRSQAGMDHAFGPGWLDEVPHTSLDEDGVIHTYGPGVHFDVPERTYRGDPCLRPSLTQSIAKILIERSPAHAWTSHPRLNPKFKPDDATKYDVGNIAHALLLGRGKDLLIIEADDWRTKAAKDARDTAAGENRLGVLAKHHRMGEAIAREARAQLNAIGWNLTALGGHAEVVAIADEGGTLLRSLIDWMVDPRNLYDLKTTSQSVAPHAIPNMMASAGWAIQAAFQERILDHLDPEGAGRRVFRFIAIEDEPPYALTPVELTEGVMTMGRKMVDAAVNLWRTCTEANLWPAYGAEVCRPSYPAWRESQWLEREIEEAEREPRRRGGMLPSLMGG